MEQLYYRTKREYSEHFDSFEHSELPSVTVPGEALTMKEILAIYAKGQDVERRLVHFLDEEDITRINKFFQPGTLDLTDIEQLSADIAEMHQTIEDALEKQRKKEEDKPEPTESEEPTPEPEG